MGGDLQIVNERIAMYQSAVAAAKSKGESSKVRRYERAISSMNEMAKDLRGGKPVKISDLPPEIATAGGSVTSSVTSNKRESNDDLKELEEWASTGSSSSTSSGKYIEVVIR